MASLLDLPLEVTEMVAGYLLRHDHKACAQTCRTLRAAFIPIAWSSIELGKGSAHSLPPLPSVVQAHANHIRAIHMQHGLRPHYCAIEYRQLQSLDLQHIPYMAREEQRSLVTMAQMNSTIQDLHLSCVDLEGMQDLWETIRWTWSAPVSLSVDKINLGSSSAIDAFWLACTRYQELQLGCALPAPSSIVSSRLVFDHLKRLKVDSSRLVSSLRKILLASPNLEHLSLYGRLCGPPSMELVKTMQSARWKRLKSLHIHASYMADEVISDMLDAVPRLTEFKLEGYGFGEQAFDSLRYRHFQTLQTLSLDRAGGFSSEMAQEVLAHCSLLRSFSASHLCIGDFVKSSSPWTCTRLEQLKDFVVSPPERLLDAVAVR
ncbi:hypothetical protein BGZ99_003331 [Dissophora globulifera]|uniref:F-box domain-containing protein n=1 Tax=Dissophora globulifera TaxID=979702 RepID=A0A9P6RKT7_9FUNG|nr:hypothetical protein BGZ99_003331 [Dissophora globulifera]